MHLTVRIKLHLTLFCVIHKKEYIQHLFLSFYVNVMDTDKSMNEAL